MAVVYVHFAGRPTNQLLFSNMNSGNKGQVPLPSALSPPRRASVFISVRYERSLAAVWPAFPPRFKFASFKKQAVSRLWAVAASECLAIHAKTERESLCWERGSLLRYGGSGEQAGCSQGRGEDKRGRPTRWKRLKSSSGSLPVAEPCRVGPSRAETCRAAYPPRIDTG